MQLGIETGTQYSQSVGSTGINEDTTHYLGAVGDILTGTVLQGGDSPIVEMNGTPIQVRSTALHSMQPGEQIYLQITQSNASEITMKLVNQKDFPVNSRNSAMQTDILKNTAKFVEGWKQSQTESADAAEELQEDADAVIRNMTEEEKAKLRQMGLEVTSSNLTMVKGLLSQMRGNERKEELQDSIDSIRRQIILENPQEAQDDFHINIQENTMDISAITEEANSFLPISEEQTIYFIQHQCSFSIENLYKSEYSGTAATTSKPISEDAFRQMRAQIERTIQTAGMEVNESTLNAVRFLLNHHLPVNTDSLSTYTAIQDINVNGFQDSQVADRLTDSSAEALVTKKQTITVEFYRQTELYFPSARTVANAITEDLNQISEEGFWSFAESGLPYTLENLSVFCQGITETKTQEADTDSSSMSDNQLSNASLSALTAHRQLEEIRLKMTWEASYTLATEDIHIRAKELSQVVEALRNQERDFYRQQFLSEGIDPSEDVLRLVQDTNNKVQELPYLPAAALGVSLYSSSFTVDRLHAAGTAALQELHVNISYTKVTAYEALMTRPRSDMGDSIQKAFRNVDDILEELHLPLTEANQRAVRILGYNQIEITEESLDQVKVADGQVQTLIQNLQPSVVLNLVRDGVNPLNMPIDQLNDLIQSYINEEGITEEEKYSEFLLKLDRRGDISQEERKGYIGIYRLLDKITKSKGKDIGTLVRNGQAITLQNLLTAHRSNRAVGMDTTIDTSFGGLDILGLDNSISEEITESANAQYNQQLAEQLLNRITPDIIDEMVEESAKGSTLEEFFDTIQKQLTEEFDTMDETTLAFSEQESAESQIQDMQLQNLDAFDQTAYQFMKTMDIFPSITNMIMATDILKGTGGLFRNIANIDEDTEQTETNNQETSGASITEQLNDLTEHLNSPEEMEQAYVQLETAITETVHEKDATGTITAKDIQALKQIRAGLRIMQKMSRKEQFQIPFSMNGEWNIINLSVVQNAETKGLLQADIPTRRYGTISASLSWNQNHWESNLSADQPEGIAFLERNFAQLSDALAQITSSDSETDIRQAPTTSEMYHMAKQLVVFFKHIDE